MNQEPFSFDPNKEWDQGDRAFTYDAYQGTREAQKQRDLEGGPNTSTLSTRTGRNNMALLDTTGNAPAKRKLTYDDPVHKLAGDRITEQLSSDFTTPDAITKSRLSDFAKRRQKEEVQTREDLNRLNILRGGGATVDKLSEFSEGTGRGRLQIESEGVQRRTNSIQDAMNFATVGQAGTRLAEDVGARDRAQTETERATQAGERFTEGGLTGTLAGQVALSPVEAARQLGLPDNADPDEVKRQAAAAGYTFNETTGQYSTPRQQTLGGRQASVAERQVAVQESQQALSREIQTGQLNLARASEIFDQNFAQGQLTGMLNAVDPGRLKAFDTAFGAVQGDKNYDATLDTDSDGRIGMEDMVDFIEREGVGVATLDMQQMRQDAVKFDRQMNVAEAGQKLSEEIEKGRLNLDRAAQVFNQTLAQGQFTGIMNTVDPERLKAFDTAFGTRKGEEGYNAALDTTNDGWIGMEDMVAWVEQQGIAVPGVELQKMRQDAAQFDRQTDLAETNAAIDRAVAEGRETGIYTDPETGAELTTLQAELERKRVDEVQRSNQAGERLTEGGLTGQLPGGEQLSQVAMARKLGLADNVSTEELRLKAEAAGYTWDRFQKNFVAPAMTTLAAKQVASQINLGERAMTLQESEQKYQQWKEVGSLTGDLTLLDGNGDPVTRINPKTGVEEPMTIATLAARDIALREGQAIGKVGNDPTIEQQALDLESDIQRGQLALQSSAQAHGFNVDEATLTGIYKSMSPAETGNFMAAFGGKSDGTEPGYNARYDFDGDGEVSDSDYEEFKRISDGKGAATLAGQRLTEDKSSRSFQETMQKAGVLGRLDGETIMAEKQRLFDNMITDANTFVDVPPMSFTHNDLVAAFGSKEGDANWRPEFDIDGNGDIGLADWGKLTALEENGGRSTMVSGDPTKPDTVAYVYQPAGKRSALAAKLGIEERQLTESVRQMDEQISNASAQWQSDFAGKQVNADGSMALTYDQETESWRQPTSMEKEAHDQNTKIFNDRMDQTAGSLAGRLGLVPDDPELLRQKWLQDRMIPGTDAEAEVELNRQVIEQLRRGGKPATPENVSNLKKQWMQSALLAGLDDEKRSALSGTMAQIMFGSQYNVQYQPGSGLGPAIAGAVGTGLGAWASAGFPV
uniref:EF-hand domain-containing protein n=1 Tax=viral metagenome TaxID=1070528 RepID=A0A6M3J4C1_9ZZZZ